MTASLLAGPRSVAAAALRSVALFSSIHFHLLTNLSITAFPPTIMSTASSSTTIIHTPCEVEPCDMNKSHAWSSADCDIIASVCEDFPLALGILICPKMMQVKNSWENALTSKGGKNEITLDGHLGVRISYTFELHSVCSYVLTQCTYEPVTEEMLMKPVFQTLIHNSGVHGLTEKDILFVPLRKPGKLDHHHVVDTKGPFSDALQEKARELNEAWEASAYSGEAWAPGPIDRRERIAGVVDSLRAVIGRERLSRFMDGDACTYQSMAQSPKKSPPPPFRVLWKLTYLDRCIVVARVNREVLRRSFEKH
jgi:hypothetical protein